MPCAAAECGLHFMLVPWDKDIQTLWNLIFGLRAIPEKKTWEGKTAGYIFFYGWLVRKVFKLYGSLVSDQIKLHGWLVFRCVEGEERILSAQKREKFYQI